MTISTISSGIGLNTLAGSNSSFDVQHGVAPRQTNTSEAPAMPLISPTPKLGLDRSSTVPPTPVVNGLGQGLRFSTDPLTGTSVITVVDVDSGKVVRQIPSEEVLDFMRQLRNSKGVLLSREF